MFALSSRSVRMLCIALAVLVLMSATLACGGGEGGVVSTEVSKSVGDTIWDAFNQPDAPVSDGCDHSGFIPVCP